MWKRIMGKGGNLGTIQYWIMSSFMKIGATLSILDENV
jgi:hypothetical protein